MNLQTRTSDFRNAKFRLCKGLFTERWRTPGHIFSIFLFDHLEMIGEVALIGWLPGLPGIVNLSAGVAFLHVDVSRCVPNPPSRAGVEFKLQLQTLRTSISTFCLLRMRRSRATLALYCCAACMSS